MDAQAARTQSHQSLNVFVDTALVGTINPSNTKYSQFNIIFSVGAGTHAIIFQGTRAGDFIVLIDSTGFSLPGRSLGESKSQGTR
jgi:hypothetical protein